MQTCTYGFNWWFNTSAGSNQSLAWPEAPPDTFQANGHWNKEDMTVIPSLGLEVAARGNWGTFEPANPAAMNQNLKLLVNALLDRP